MVTTTVIERGFQVRWRGPKPAVDVGLGRVKEAKLRLSVPHGPGIDSRLKREHFNKIWWLVELDEVARLRQDEGAPSAWAKLHELDEVADRLGLHLNLTSFWSRFWPGPLLRHDLRCFVDMLERRLEQDRRELSAWSEIESAKDDALLVESWLQGAALGPRSRRSPLACD